MSSIPIKQQRQRTNETHLKVIVGAGLGGVGAAIALLLAGHDVQIFEAASEIAEVGAGVQVLPNSSRVLQSWGMKGSLDRYSTKPSRVNMLGWKGNLISHMDFEEAVELGAEIRVRSRVLDVQIHDSGDSVTLILGNGEEHTADLVVGADGINSRLREIMLGHPDPPQLSGDLAYRLLLSTKEMLKDPELASIVTDPQVNYWLEPDAHAVNYVLRGGELFNMVLLVTDDMPAGASTLAGNVDEMRPLYEGWDPRIPKLLNLCESVYKWRLCIRPGMETWSHPSGAFTLLGDAVHATLPYLASGAGMALEDAAVLGELFGRSKNPRAPAEKQQWATYGGTPEPSFLATLKTFMNPDASATTPELNALSSQLILHGLMSIVWDLKRRDQTSLGSSGPTSDWQTHLGASYDMWRVDFDAYCMDMTKQLRNSPAAREDFTRFSTSTRAIYHAAQLILHVEVLDLQICAGAKHILGRPVAPHDYQRSRKRMKRWVSDDGPKAAVAASHAAHLLRDGLTHLED
nr:hypothetical protein B0A51_04736 [Rachicladosporium sp. CCFEE 5018]